MYQKPRTQKCKDKILFLSRMKTKRHSSFFGGLADASMTTPTTDRRRRRRRRRRNGWVLLLVVFVLMLAKSRKRRRTRAWTSCGRCVVGNAEDGTRTRRAWCGTTRRCGNLYEVGACGEDLVMDVERCPMVFRDALCGGVRVGVKTGALCDAYDVVRRTLS